MRIIHMFNWQLVDIESELINIKDQGFDAVQINPIQPLKEDNYNLWWLSYQPCAFAIGNIYGTKEELISLCSLANKIGINIIADVICNHTASAVDNTLFPHEKVDAKLRTNRAFWKEKRNINNWNNRLEVINYCMHLPGLNPNNHELQDIIIKFLDDLLDCGVCGFRFDAAKNIALPEEGCDFWPRVLKKLKDLDIFTYGEIIFESHELIKEYGKYFKVLTESRINDKNSCVVFVESHDTYFEFKNTAQMTSDEVTHEYRDLCHEFPHTLYYARPYDLEWRSEKIKEANKGAKQKQLVKN